VSAARPSLFGPIALIALGVLILIHNLVDDYSLWTPLLDYWPWFLVAWGGLHVTQHAVALANGSPGPRRLGGGAIIVALLICAAGEAGRSIRANDGIILRGFGVQVRLRDKAFRSRPADGLPERARPHESP
jgi:hypothetical protein